jgi:hypothetical protein
MNDIAWSVLALLVGASVGFTVGWGIAYAQGVTDGIERERSYLDRRARQLTRERKL